MIKIDKKSFLNLRDFLNECDKPYTVSVSQSRMILKCFMGTYTCSSDAMLPLNQLHFIKRVQAHVKKNKVTEHVKNKFKNGYQRIKYYKFAPGLKGQTFNDCWEIDIKSAYWHSAFKLGIITEDIFSKGLEMQKTIRLASLGSLARKTIIHEFDGKNMKPATYNKNEETEYLWFLISDLIGKRMYESYKIAGDNFLFFWIDGIYVCDKKTATKIEKHFKDCGFLSVTKKIKSIEFKEKYVLVTDYNYRLNRYTGEKKYTRKFSASL